MSRRGASLMMPALMMAALLPGCGWFGGGGPGAREGELGEVVAALPPLALPEARAAAPTREEVMAAYQGIYGRLPDPRDDHAVGKRLADLSMGAGEDRHLAGDTDPYRGAIELYQSLLEGGSSEDRDEIVYQLARAHDLAGNGADSRRWLDRLVAEHPDSRFLVEARFRRGEMAFSAGRYAEAAADFAFVAQQGRGTPFWQNATYMHGWSAFKRADADEALESFFTVIDSLAADAESDALPATERELLDDTLRVVNLALGYLDGPASLASRMRSRGRPPWQYLAYRALAEDYQRRERYLDSVATWDAFVAENPLDARAPRAELGVIETLLAADFPSEAAPRKQAFVRRYGIHSGFWQAHRPEVRKSYLPPLRSFLEELARRHHADAQASGQRRDHLAAAEWYQELVQTFPEDPRTPDYLFLLGEVYTEADEPGHAVAAYQRVVREYPDHVDAAEAGYAAILGLERLERSAAAEEHELWQRVKIDAQIEFAFSFAGDSRAPEVQADAADSLFALGEHEQAMLLAENLLAAWPELSWPLRRAALTIQGHGRFELGEYAAAEDAYRALLAGPLDEAERAPVTKRLLASVFRQAEAAEAATDVEAAVDHFLRLTDIAPGAELAVQGHFDAVAVLEAAGDPARAADLLSRFRDAHGEHPLARDATRRLAALYEQTGDTSRAAAEYVALAEDDADAEVRRQARYRAAELYLQQGDSGAAITQLERYARGHPEPLAQRLEAVHQLDVLLRDRGDEARRREWLEQKVAIHRAMGNRVTERANYLAAGARLELAREARAAFDAVRLAHPLAESLERKRRALQAAVAAYEVVAEYRVAEFASASTYHMATLFTDLARAILESDRPGGLSELEREQYEVLLEEQAFPFEEQAIALHEVNMHRSWDGLWDRWIEQSFAELGRLMPARFDKRELEVVYVETIH